MIVAKLGPKVVHSFHKRSIPFVSAHLILVFLIVGLNAWMISASSLWVVTIGAVILQGFSLQHFGYLMHEIGVHNGFGNRKVSKYFGTILGTISLASFTEYRLIHLAHHVETGAPWDEAYKQNLDSRWKRLLNLTAPGLALLYKKPPYSRNAKLATRIAWEKSLVALFVIVLAGLTWLFPDIVGLGLVLPMLVSLPIASNFRLILRHAEADSAYPLACATFYKTGPVTRVLFGWDAGDCHLVHHLFPNIPSFRMADAIRAISPLLKKRGINQRTNFVELLYLWFIYGCEHRTIWKRRIQGEVDC